MDKFGENFRLFRKERGFTLKEMSKEIISFSYLSKFEKGKSDITLNNFVRLLEKLNMTSDEFLLFNNVDIAKYTKLFQKISLAYSANDKKKLLYYLKEEEVLFEKSSIIYHKCNAIMISVIIQDIDKSFSVSNHDSNFLKDYLIKCSSWTDYEVNLLGNILVLFSDELLIILVNEIKSRLIEEKIVRRNRRNLIALLQNSCIIFLRRKMIKEANDVSIFLEGFLEPHHFFEKTRKLFIDGIILITTGERSAGIEKSTQAIELIKVLNSESSDDYETELQFFLSFKKPL